MTTFATHADAIDAGYVYCPRHTYREFILSVSDVSGPNSFGYDYALTAHGADDTPASESAAVTMGEFGLRRYGPASVSLWFTESRNKMDTMGAFSAGWWLSADFDAACIEFRAAVDAVYLDSQALRHIERQAAAGRAASDAAARVKRAQRARRLAEKYGAENLSAEWQSELAGAA